MPSGKTTDIAHGIKGSGQHTVPRRKFTAWGRVTRIQFDGETGTVFTGMESTDPMVLDKWLGESRTNGRR